jgi:hypothetical protein
MSSNELIFSDMSYKICTWMMRLWSYWFHSPQPALWRTRLNLQIPQKAYQEISLFHANSLWSSLESKWHVRQEYVQWCHLHPCNQTRKTHQSRSQRILGYHYSKFVTISYFSLHSLFQKNKKNLVWSPCCLCSCVPPPYQLLNGWVSHCELVWWHLSISE